MVRVRINPIGLQMGHNHAPRQFVLGCARAHFLSSFRAKRCPFNLEMDGWCWQKMKKWSQCGALGRGSVRFAGRQSTDSNSNSRDRVGFELGLAWAHLGAKECTGEALIEWPFAALQRDWPCSRDREQFGPLERSKGSIVAVYSFIFNSGRRLSHELLQIWLHSSALRWCIAES